jgi:hypothetical protein
MDMYEKSGYSQAPFWRDHTLRPHGELHLSRPQQFASSHPQPPNTQMNKKLQLVLACSFWPSPRRLGVAAVRCPFWVLPKPQIHEQSEMLVNSSCFRDRVLYTWTSPCSDPSAPLALTSQCCNQVRFHGECPEKRHSCVSLLCTNHESGMVSGRKVSSLSFIPPWLGVKLLYFNAHLLQWRWKFKGRKLLHHEVLLVITEDSRVLGHFTHNFFHLWKLFHVLRDMKNYFERLLLLRSHLGIFVYWLTFYSFHVRFWYTIKLLFL